MKAMVIRDVFDGEAELSAFSFVLSFIREREFAPVHFAAADYFG